MSFLRKLNWKSAPVVAAPCVAMLLTNLHTQAFGLLICLIFVTAVINHHLAQKHPSDVRVVWYLFALSATISALLAHWAQGYGAIDSTGNFQGTTGAALSFLLKASLDVESSTAFCLAIIAVVLIPQIVSYLLSGLSGCAQAPIFISSTVSFFAWGLVKSLTVASGVVLVVPLYAYLNKWSNATGNEALGMALLSAQLIGFAFVVLAIYREVLDIPEMINKALPSRLRQAVTASQIWLTRRSRPSSRGSNE